MKRIRHTLYSLLLVVAISCTHDRKPDESKASIPTTDTTQAMPLYLDNPEEIKKYLLLQQRIGSDEVDYENPHHYQQKDFELTLPIIREGLRKAGYKTPERNEFYRLSADILGFPPPNEAKDFWYSSEESCPLWNHKSNFFSHLPLVDRDGYFILMPKGNHFMTQALRLKEVLKEEADGNYRIQLPPFLIARNKYLFNGDKSQIRWLLDNDPVFMRLLVTHFGYTKDPVLVSWMLNHNRFLTDQYRITNPDFEHIFYHKTCQGKIVMHQEAFNIVKEEYQKDNNTLPYIDLESFHADLAQGRGDLTFAQRAELLARIGYWGETVSMTPESQRPTFSFFRHLQGQADKYEQEFKKHDYYNLPNFKEIWDETKTGGVTLYGEMKE